jgi:hypothetical protein
LANSTANSNIGKGIVLLITKQGSPDFAVRSLGFGAIYSTIGVRDAGRNDQLGKAMMAGPMRWQGITRLRAIRTSRRRRAGSAARRSA